MCHCQQVDTLRLAIGYISFLAELVANDRHPSDVMQSAVPEPPKKIFISSTKGKMTRHHFTGLNESAQHKYLAFN